MDYGEDLIADTNLDAVVEGLLEPLTEDRLSAADALQLLRAPAAEARCVCRCCFGTAVHFSTM